MVGAKPYPPNSGQNRASSPLLKHIPICVYLSESVVEMHASGSWTLIPRQSLITDYSDEPGLMRQRVAEEILKRGDYRK
jgi:hypothetical protein